MSKEQATSGDTWSCCETGEEGLAEGAVPTVDQLKQAAGMAEDLATLLATVLVRADRTHKAVHRGERVVLAPKL